VTEPLLDVSDLRTYFTTEEGIVRAVDGISFTMEPGQRLGVVGESGSGKSVTALSVMGLIEPPAGKIVTGRLMFKGRNLLELDEDEMQAVRGGQIAMIFQDPMTALNPVYTIGDQLMETILLHQDVNRSGAREIAIQAIDDVQIPNAAQRMTDYPHQYSGGMRQRIMIAMGLSCNPDLLIADEPTTALDVTTQAQIMDLMLQLAEDRGTAVMLITHDLGVVAGFCDDVHVMYAGGIVESGTINDIYYNPQHPYTWGLLRSMTRLDDVQRHRLHSVRGAPPSVIDLPHGCRFRPRCDFATDVCGKILPALREVGNPGQQAACHHAEELDLQTMTAGEADTAAAVVDEDLTDVDLDADEIATETGAAAESAMEGVSIEERLS
jgi:oligopeptide transport system ATP-binding protein